MSLRWWVQGLALFLLFVRSGSPVVTHVLHPSMDQP
jgi:hypothetical protein